MAILFTLYDVVIPILGFFIVFINTLIVLSSGLVLKRGVQPKTTYLFLGNLGMADLITGIAIIFDSMYPTEYKNFYICATQLGLTVSATTISVYSVGLVAVDRYIYIAHGLKYRNYINTARAQLLIVVTWLLGAAVAFLCLVGWGQEYQQGEHCWFVKLASKAQIIFVVSVGVFPLLTTIVLYVIILYRALGTISFMKHAAKTKTESNDGLRAFRGSSRDEQTPKDACKITKKISKWKSIKIVLFTSVSFIITWVPYFIAALLYTTCNEDSQISCKTLEILLVSPLDILGYMNSLLNPIIYIWWHRGLRKFYRDQLNIITRKFRLKKYSSTAAITTISGGIII